MKFSVVSFLCLAYHSVQGSLVGKTPEELQSPYASRGPAVLLESFPINLENLRALSGILNCKEHDFYQYYSVPESPERAALFKQFAGNEELHGTVFHHSKLNKNPEWYDWFFPAKHGLPGSGTPSDETDDVIEYKANLFDKMTLAIDIPKMKPKTIESIILNQLSKVPSPVWIGDALTKTSKEFILGLFSSFSTADITVESLNMVKYISGKDAILENFLSRLEHLEDDKEKELYQIMLWYARKTSQVFAEFDARLDSTPGVYKLESLSQEDALTLITPMREGRTDKAFWSVYFKLVVYSWKKDESHILWIIENIPKNVISPLDMNYFVEEYWELCSLQKRQSLLAMVPPEFRSEELRSMDEWRASWARSVFTTDRNIRTFDDISLGNFYMTALLGIVPSKLSLNMLCRSNTEPGAIPFSDRLIKESMNIVKSTKTYSNRDLVVVMVAWPYMIAEGKKGDFSRLFPQKSTPTSWEIAVDLMPKLNAGTQQYVNFVSLLQLLNILAFFTPKQLRELIDSSYNPAEDQ